MPIKQNEKNHAINRRIGVISSRFRYRAKLPEHADMMRQSRVPQIKMVFVNNRMIEHCFGKESWKCIIYLADRKINTLTSEDAISPKELTEL